MWRIPQTITIALCLMTTAAFSYPESETAQPAMAEREITAEDSLNPLLDLVRAQRENEAKLRKALEKPITIAFEDIPLDEAMRRIAKTADVNIWIDEWALQEESVKPNDPVSCTAKGISLQQSLRQTLEPLGLDYLIEDEVIKITTIIVAEERLKNRDFEVEDLLQWEKQHRYEPRALSNTVIHTELPHPWLTGTILHETSGPWVELDEIGGTIEYQGSLMTVRHTDKVLNEIPQILKMFRLFTENKFGKDRGVFLENLSTTDPNLEVRRALAKRVDWNFQNIKLQDLATQLSKEWNVPVKLDRQTLVEEGVDPKTPVTLRIQNVTAHSALRIILEPLGLTVMIENGTLVFYSTIAAEERHIGMVHDVRDLINSGGLQKETFLKSLWAETSGAWADVHGMGGGVSEPLPGLLLVWQTEYCQKEVVAYMEKLRRHVRNRKAQGLPPKPAPKTPQPNDVIIEFYQVFDEAKPDAVQAAIYDLIASKTWKPNGGQGSIHVINNFLVIKNQVKVHRKVNHFLNRLSTSLNNQTPEYGLGTWGATGIWRDELKRALRDVLNESLKEKP